MAKGIDGSYRPVSQGRGKGTVAEELHPCRAVGWSYVFT